MNFTTCLQEQLHLHPAMQPRDVIKLCYQAARGAEHLLADLTRARAYFDQEYAVTPADASTPLFEAISENVARVNIAAWKAASLPAEWLFRMFAYTASIPMGDNDLLETYIAEASAIAGDLPAWAETLAAWQADGMPAVHHSEAYRAAERPAYRIVNGRFACILPLLQQLKEQPDVRVIAIDGRAASGKSTKAELLSTVLAAPIIHMDDFFLPPALRTPERLSAPGGNVHYERFPEEVLPGLASGESFSYRIFDCSQMDFGGERPIPACPVRIVEGSYAHHPELGRYADLLVFSTVGEEKQMARILRRNGEKMAEMFRTRWIPMEENYFRHFSIRDKADIVL